MVIAVAAIFFVGFGAGILAEHVAHYLLGCKGHPSTEEHSHNQ